MDCNGSTHQQRFAEWQLLPTIKTPKKETKLLTTRGGGGGIMEESLSMQSKKLQKGVFRMNSVMKQTTQAALFVKGVCRTASHMAIGPLVAVESFPLQHDSGSRIWAIRGTSK